MNIFQVMVPVCNFIAVLFYSLADKPTAETLMAGIGASTLFGIAALLTRK